MRTKRSARLVAVVAAAALLVLAAAASWWGRGATPTPGTAELAVAIEPSQEPSEVDRGAPARVVPPGRVDADATLASVVVRVRFRDGAPASVTSLRCVADDRLPEAPVLARDDGAFAVEVAPVWRRLAVRGVGPNFAAFERLVLRADADRFGEVVLYVDRVVTLRLRVLDHGFGTPVEAVPLTLAWRRAGRGDRAVRPTRSGISDAHGRLELGGLEPGCYDVAAAAGHRVVLPGVVVVGTETGACDVFVCSDHDWELSGRVVAASEPAAGVAGADVSLDGFTTIAHTDASGRFTLPGSARLRQTAPYFHLTVTPPRTATDLALHRAGPFVWEPQELRIELPPARHCLRVLYDDGRPVAAVVELGLGRVGYLGHEPGWRALASIGPGEFELPWQPRSDLDAWLRARDAAGGHRHVQAGALPRKTAAAAVWHEWTLPSPRELTVTVRDERGAGIAGAEVEALFQLAGGGLRRATVVDEYDPRDANPLLANRAERCAVATTGVDGRCQLVAAWREGVGLRCSHPDFHVEVVDLGARVGGEVHVVLLPAGSLRGTVRDVRGREPEVIAQTLDGAPRDELAHARAPLRDGAFAFASLRAGTYALWLSVRDGDERFPFPLGEVDVPPRGEQVFAASVHENVRAHVELAGELVPGDRVTAIHAALGFPVADVAVVRTGGCELRLAPGSYQLVRRRREPGIGGHELPLLAEQPLVVTGALLRVAVAFVARPGRVRLRAVGRPYAASWVRLAGSVDAVTRTNADGEASFACWPGPSFVLDAVQSTTSGWRPTGPRWFVDTAAIDGVVDAR